MANIRQAGQTGTARRWVALALWGVLGLASGCSSTPHASAPPIDPLHGPLVPPGTLPPTDRVPKNDGGAQASIQGGVPAIPTSLTATNTATLAGMSWQGPLGQPLAIDDKNSFGPGFLPRQSGGATNTQQVPGLPGYIPPNPNPKVEAVPDSNPGSNVGTPPMTTWQTQSSNQPIVQPASAAVPASAEALAKQLQDRGVLDQKQVLVPEGVRLTCYISRGPEGGFRILEATAADYPAAAQAILAQLNVSR